MFRTLANIFIYVCFFALVHYFYGYIKDTFTTKKKPDLVKLHQEKYQEILQDLDKTSRPVEVTTGPPQQTTLLHDIDNYAPDTTITRSNIDAPDYWDSVRTSMDM